jgi:hypothetical protein
MILFCGRTSAKVNDNAILFLQPEWSKQEEMTPFVDYVMSNKMECLFRHINILIFLKEFRINKKAKQLLFGFFSQNVAIC